MSTKVTEITKNARRETASKNLSVRDLNNSISLDSMTLQ
jgi:hypothetical protein